MGVSRQTVTSWEIGCRGMPVPALTCALETLGEKTAPVQRGPAPKTQQRFVMQVLESVLAQASR